MVHELGTVGMVCPFPLIEAQKKMNTLDNGEELKIDFDCTQAT
ncbi:sulfurtransferase TusA family protein, partial [Staphylococcus aureus]